MTITILGGDCRSVLATLPDGLAQCCVTSPPYFGLRDYGHAEQIGAEATPDDYVAEMVAVFREVRRVLANDGTVWLNLGDSYAGGGNGSFRPGAGRADGIVDERNQRNRNGNGCPVGYKPKDLLMIPARVALALQADGWWLRSDIIWVKPNAMPESVTDRCTSAHEHVFLLTKHSTYFYDADAIAEPVKKGAEGSFFNQGKTAEHQLGRSSEKFREEYLTRNARNVWTIATQPYSGAHFATMPPELVERCIKAGSKPGDMVLDPFGGAGTTGLVADRLGRDATLIELNPTYAELARNRIKGDAGMFACVQSP